MHAQRSNAETMLSIWTSLQLACHDCGSYVHLAHLCIWCLSFAILVPCCIQISAKLQGLCTSTQADIGYTRHSNRRLQNMKLMPEIAPSSMIAKAKSPTFLL